MIPSEEIADVEGAAHADKVAYGVGMLEGNVGRVIGAETRAAHAYSMDAGSAPRKIENIMHNDIFIRDVSADAISRMNRFVVKAVEIDRVRAIDSNFAVIDKPGDGRLKSLV